jgi:chemotaxis protein CheD
LDRNSHIELTKAKARCLPEFSNINHYWDKNKEIVVAKILPGEFYMTSNNISIATTLGSCISACIWDSHSGVGGMNHFMLPLTDKEAHEVDWGSRGLSTDATRYGNFAMEHLVNMVLKYGGRKVNLRAKVFGGGKILQQMSDVGQKNIDFVLAYLKAEGIFIENSDLGLNFPRKVIFEPRTGRALVKRLTSLHNDTITNREKDYKKTIDHIPVGGDIELF